jgi:hypothetical protein
MAQFYTLDQAARILGMSPEELKQKAQSREIRAYQDSGTWQFRVADVDEMARRRGLGSDPDLSLSDLDLEVPPDSDVDLAEFRTDTGAVKGGKGSGEGDVLLDDVSVPPELTGSSSTIIGMKPTGKKPSDSDVKLVPPEAGRSASDSDVRLAKSPKVRPSDSDVTLVADDTGEQPSVKFEPKKPKKPADVGGFDPGETSLRPSPLLGSSGEVPAAAPGDSDSDFELTPSSVIDALQPDSGSDFELTALEASDEFEATPRSPSDSDVTGAVASASGVNLAKPSDSGINLLQGGLDLGGSGDSIELAPLEEDKSAKPAKPAKPVAATGKGRPKADPGATALPVKPSGEKNIFDTDFEVDALDTAAEDRTMQLEPTSDFDSDDADSASEVFAVDEEDVDDSAATAMATAPVGSDADIAEQAPTGSAESWGAIGSDESDSGTAAAPARAPSPMLAASSGAEWGLPWVILLGLSAFFMLIGTFVGLDLVSNLNEFRSDGPASGLVRTIAGLFGGG